MINFNLIDRHERKVQVGDKIHYEDQYSSFDGVVSMADIYTNTVRIQLDDHSVKSVSLLSFEEKAELVP